MKTHCKRGHPLVEGNLYANRRYKTCRECVRVSSRASYLRNQEVRKAYWRTRRKQTYGKIKARVQEIRAHVKALRTACIKCGETHPACLDFHHRNPAEKSFPLNANQMGNRSWNSINAEIAKCDVLCSNCHRKLHYEEGTGSYASQWQPFNT